MVLATADLSSHAVLWANGRSIVAEHVSFRTRLVYTETILRSDIHARSTKDNLLVEDCMCKVDECVLVGSVPWLAVKRSDGLHSFPVLFTAGPCTSLNQQTVRFQLRPHTLQYVPSLLNHPLFSLHTRLSGLIIRLRVTHFQRLFLG